MTMEGFGNFPAIELGIVIVPSKGKFDDYFCAETAQK
jgi:hypothetical protein